MSLLPWLQKCPSEIDWNCQFNPNDMKCQVDLSVLHNTTSNVWFLVEWVASCSLDGPQLVCSIFHSSELFMYCVPGFCFPSLFSIYYPIDEFSIQFSRVDVTWIIQLFQNHFQLRLPVSYNRVCTFIPRKYIYRLVPRLHTIQGTFHWHDVEK